MNETLLIKHAVGGRTFIDTSARPLIYAVEAEGDGWRLAVQTPLTGDVEELLRWKDELNVFLFQTFADRPTLKIWFYVKDNGVAYDEAGGVLHIAASSRIDYVPDEFGGPK
ncbi:hypothetical protein B5M42_017000 [Paenibacillus athensensis]|uniref:Uncharacterized protein n=1 Tax=Paenibacillus athensensis TaxID=1967502 RepID=A0A4Y8PQT6_9BACL|nr:hypothetical protein [Paenibacillus athensensis]MCD1260501.1 hypothetical protein [Paenibacillus athensensis]